MRSARHLGKIVLTTPPLVTGSVAAGSDVPGDRRPGRYRVRRGPAWLADRGAGAIVLNGRRPPDPEVQKEIDSLRERGFAVRVELADVTDAAAVDGMLARMDRELPPLGGVIHSVGVLSDASLPNQSWERFRAGAVAEGAGSVALAPRDRRTAIWISSSFSPAGSASWAIRARRTMRRPMRFWTSSPPTGGRWGFRDRLLLGGAWSEIGEAAEQKDRIERQRAALGRTLVYTPAGSQGVRTGWFARTSRIPW